MDNLNGYKAFEPGMICKGKQYQENTDYEEEGGERIKADTWYKLIDGEFTEVSP